MIENTSKLESLKSKGSNHPEKIISSVILRAGLAATLMGLPLASNALAQQATDDDNALEAAEGGSDTLETVIISGDGDVVNTNTAVTSSSRLPGSLRDVPQTVNVIPERILTQQNVTTLEQALANVPGITVSIGEGNGGMNGDRFRIRGFEALGDQYRDGLRDFGIYQRDSFNMEQVEVFKGPNGENFGVGTSGGAINSGSKRARLGNFGSANISFGSGSLIRPEVDYNWQFGDTSAVRFNLMGNWQDVVDRNHMKSDRHGAAVSLGLGLGTSQTLHLDYMYQHNDKMSDYGIPFVYDPNHKNYRPATEYGLSRKMFYGKDTDGDKSNIHVVTASYKNEFNDWLTLHNDTRYSHFDRKFRTTPVSCPQPGGNLRYCYDILRGNIAGNPVLSIGAGGNGPGYEQTSWGIQNITTAIAKFETGGLRHEAVIGLDMMYQDDERYGLSYLGGSKIPPRLFEENTYSGNYNIVRNPNNFKDSNSYNVALFASDRLWFNDQWSVMAGLRWEHQKTNYNVTNGANFNSYKADAHWVSPKASIIWEPNESQSYYLSWSIANNLPSGQYVTSDTWPVGNGQEEWKPEKTHLYELGTKLDFFDGDLGITAAIFHLEKGNAIRTDGVSGDLVRTGEKQRIQGLELGLTGKITAQWTIYGSYTYLKSKILDADPADDGQLFGASIIGNSIGGVAKNAATLWTTYNLAPHFDLDGELLIGGGMRYRDAMYTRSDNFASVPHSFSVDGLISYETEKWNLSLNAYNLTDRVNYDTYFEGRFARAARAVPSSGRSFVVKLGTKF